MIYRQIRNHTFLLEYAGHRFLFNPALDFGSTGGPEGMSMDEILDVDAVIVTRLCDRYFDSAARQLIPRGTRILVRDKEDAAELTDAGFTNAEPVGEKTRFENLDFYRTPVYHGRGEERWQASKSFGLVIFHPVLNSLYLTGDSIWFDGMKGLLKKWKPHMVLISARYNVGVEKEIRWGMDREEIAAVHLTFPRAKIISTEASGMDDMDLGRSELKAYLRAHRMDQAVLLPESGEEYRL